MNYSKALSLFRRERFLSLGLWLLLAGVLSQIVQAQPVQAETRAVSGRQLAPAAEDFFSSSSLLAQLSQPAQRQPRLPADGIYLFGQQPQPDQLETTYLVFEALAGEVTGAFYMPYSSFDCVQGRLQETQLALTITDSYSEQTFAYALGLERDTVIASANRAATVSIDGFYPLPVADNDLAILGTCKAYYDSEI